MICISGASFPWKIDQAVSLEYEDSFLIFGGTVRVTDQTNASLCNTGGNSDEIYQ